MGTRSDARRSAAGPVHLVEVGLRWPPETFLRWKFEGLAARGLRVTVASAPGDRDESVRLSGVRLARVPGTAGSRAAVIAGAVRHALPVAARDPDLVRRLARATWGRTRGSRRRRIWETLRRLRLYLPMARLRPDVVHVEWNTTAKRYLPFIEAWRGPVVVSCHGTGIHLRPYVPPTDSEREELRASLRAATVVHCVSESMVREATALGMPPTAARLIRPAVDPDEFRPVPRRRETHELRVVGVGRMRWSKAWELAILAVRNCRASGVPARLDLLGGWHSSEHSAEELGEQERLRWAVADLELEGLVRLHGAVPSSTVRDTLQRSDVLIHPSLAESTPTVVLEAMACELPVVVADVGGVREAVTDGVEGFVVPPRDPDAMAEALRTLWVDPELGPRMGRAGRARVQARFRLDHQVDAFQALYRELTEKDAAPLAPIAHPGPPPSSGASPPPADGRALRILSAGRLEWPQGYEYAIEAVRLLADRGVPCAYRIVGEGQLLPALAFARHQLGVGQVDLAGAAGPAGLDDHLAWAEVFVHPSVVDGVPDEVVRAHAAGLPVVMTDPGDGVEHPPRADVVPRRDPGAIADALETLAVRLSPPTIACR